MDSFVYVTNKFANADAWDYSVPAFCDFDKDGDFDLFIGGGYGTIYFYKNIGNPDSSVFSLVTETYAGIDVAYKATPTFCDIDNDGDLDLFIGNDYGVVHQYKNNGATSNPQWTLVTTKYGGINFGYLDYTTPVFADLDKDNDFDLYLSESFGNINFYENIGSPSDDSLKWNTDDYISGTIDVGSGSSPCFVDIDGDGKKEMFLGKGNGHIRYCKNFGTVEFPDWHMITPSFLNADLGGGTPIFADIDSDGLNDFFVSSDYRIYYYKNVGTIDSSIYTLQTNNYITNNFGYSAIPRFGDIDSDGDLDCIYSNYDSKYIRIIKNVGTPDSAIWSLPSIVLDSTIKEYYKPFPVDFDFDGDIDLVAYHTDPWPSITQGYRLIRQNKINNEIHWEVDNSIFIGIPYSYDAFVVSDLNGDCTWDVILGDGIGGLYFWKSCQDLISIAQNDPFCTNDSPKQLSINYPNGGFWDGIGVQDNGVFDPSVGAGSYLLTYSKLFGGCITSDTTILHVNQSPNVQITPIGPFCIDEGSQILSAVPKGGLWEGTYMNECFDPSIGVGTYLVIYTYVLDTTMCSSSDSINIEVKGCSNPQDLKSPFEIKIIPNPFVGENLYFIATGWTTHVKVEIFSEDGRLIKKFDDVLLCENIPIKLAVPELIAGAYLIRISDKSRTITRKFIRAK
jgi:hypothetical protein